MSETEQQEQDDTEPQESEILQQSEFNESDSYRDILLKILKKKSKEIGLNNEEVAKERVRL